MKHIINFSVNLVLFGLSDRRPLTSLHRLWSCTAQSPRPCRTWRCSLLRSLAAWWRIMSASLTLNKACMEVTSTEVCCSHLPWYWLIFECRLKLNSVLDTVLRGFLCIPDQKGGYQQKQSYQRGMLKHKKYGLFGCCCFFFFSKSTWVRVAEHVEQGKETGLIPIILFSGLLPDQKSGYQQNKGGYQRGGYRNQNQSNYWARKDFHLLHSMTLKSVLCRFLIQLISCCSSAGNYHSSSISSCLWTLSVSQLVIRLLMQIEKGIAVQSHNAHIKYWWLIQ